MQNYNKSLKRPKSICPAKLQCCFYLVLSFMFWLVHVIESVTTVIPWEETRLHMLLKLALILCLWCCKADSLSQTRPALRGGKAVWSALSVSSSLAWVSLPWCVTKTFRYRLAFIYLKHQIRNWQKVYTLIIYPSVLFRILRHKHKQLNLYFEWQRLISMVLR